jgi:acyl-CoA dehydrogenase
MAFAGRIGHAVTLDGGMVRLLGPLPGAASLAHGEDGFGVYDPALATLIETAPAPDWMTPPAVRALAAAVRAAQMAGAIAAALDLTLAYTSEREQFGRALSKFQAIQHHLAEMAGESAAAAAAVQLAAEAIADDPDMGVDAREMAAIAKIRCGDAAARAAAAAHQAHGAMGFTYEYPLGRLTRRLWQWQDDFGAEAHWAVALGRTHLTTRDAPLWPRIAR